MSTRHKASAWGALSVAVALGMTSCGEDSNEDRLQSSCVRSILDFSDDLSDGAECSNFGYADCEGFASDCVHYCAFDRCQAEECQNDEDCAIAFNSTYECEEYIVNDESYGMWCDESECPKGTLGCPCYADQTCAADPYGSGSMSCESGVCTSECPPACRSGSSICCGGALCSGDCIGTPCC